MRGKLGSSRFPTSISLFAEGSMKYTRLSTRTAPSSLQDWLEEQLERLGIDGVVYTRYVLSLLHEEDDCDPSAEADPSALSKGLTNYFDVNLLPGNYCCSRQQKCKRQPASKKFQHKRHQNSAPLGDQTTQSATCFECLSWMSPDQRKSAVVDCLKSASDQEQGVESLVDELCAKLKEIRSNNFEVQNSLLEKEEENESNSELELVVDSKEVAKRYYAAFPALNCSELCLNQQTGGEAAASRRAFLLSSEDRAKWDGSRVIGVVKRSHEQPLDLGHNESEGLHPEKSVTPEGYFEAKNDLLSQQYEGSLFLNTFDCNKNGSEELNQVIFGTEFMDPLQVQKEWEEDKLKKLVSKFNSGIASIWSDTSRLEDGACPGTASIWTFDTSSPFSSPQSSSSPSPKLTSDSVRQIWQTSCDLPSDSVTCLSNNLWKTSPCGRNFSWSSETNNNDLDLLFSLKCLDIPSFASLSLNKTSLSNHGGNSLFVEVASLRPPSVDSIAATAPAPAPALLSAPAPLPLPSSVSASNLMASKTVAPQTSGPETAESPENLLTSPKTHFMPIRPIKQDSFERGSEEGPFLEVDSQVVGLVPCSPQCPNRTKKTSNSSDLLTSDANNDPTSARALSTSLSELASYMGPFTEVEDGEVLREEGPECSQPSQVNDAFYNLIEDFSITDFESSRGSDCSDKVAGSDLTRDDVVLNEEDEEEDQNLAEKMRLLAEEDPDAENETDFADLCNLLDQVLREKVVEKGNEKETLDSSSAVASWDWFDEEKEMIGGNNSRERRLSWGCYWDAFRSETSATAAKDDQLKALQKEIKQEEDEIFADIGIIGREFHEDVAAEVVEEALKCKAGGNSLPEKRSDWIEEELTMYGKNDNEELSGSIEWSQDVYDYLGASNEANDEANHVFYSWDLEEEWQREEGDSSGNRLRFAKKLRAGPEFAAYSRRPCSFFLEGNCRRTDCKFSHDLRSITCKFWEEGSCFKGDLCPFLHGYYSESHKMFDEKNPNFIIESEKDFPSLAVQEEEEEAKEPLQVTEKCKGKRETQVLFRMVKKKRRKGSHQSCGEKAV